MADAEKPEGDEIIEDSNGGLTSEQPSQTEPRTTESNIENFVIPEQIESALSKSWTRETARSGRNWYYLLVSGVGKTVLPEWKWDYDGQRLPEIIEKESEEELVSFLGHIRRNFTTMVSRSMESEQCRPRNPYQKPNKEQSIMFDIYCMISDGELCDEVEDRRELNQLIKKLTELREGGKS